MTKLNGELERELLMKQAETVGRMGSWSWDLKTDKMMGSDGFFRLYGLERQELDFARFISFIHSDDKIFVMAAIDNSLRTHEPINFLRKIVLDNGNTKLVQTKADVITDAHGVAVKVVGVSQDITPNKTAQTIINEAKEVRIDANELRKSVDEFASITRRGLLRATWQGIIMIIIGVFLSVSLLSYASKSYTCGAESFMHHQYGVRYRVCNTIFPQVEDQVKLLVKTENQTKAILASDQERIKVAKEARDKIDEVNKIVKEFEQRFLTPPAGQ